MTEQAVSINPEISNFDIKNIKSNFYVSENRNICQKAIYQQQTRKISKQYHRMAVQ